MALLLNSFPADISPVQLTLPYIDYETWEDSTSAKMKEFRDFVTWRYDINKLQPDSASRAIRMVFLSGPRLPTDAQQALFDLGFFWKIGCVVIEDSLGSYFSKLGFTTEHGHFERLALRRYPASPDNAIELATGLSFSTRRPFRDEPCRFTISFQLVVRAMFKDTLASESLAAIARGMPVLYRPTGATPADLLEFKNRYLGRVRSLDNDAQTAIVMCRDEVPRSVGMRHLRLEASPSVIKLYEQKVRHRSGPSPIIRAIQQLKLSFTKDNRRNVTAFRDRLDEIRRLLANAGSSRDQLVLPLASFQDGSISVALAPIEANFGESW